MGAQPPYRMPCGSVAGKPLYFFGNPAAHATAPILVDNYVNVTLVDNPAGGAQIPPYERYQCNLGGPVCQRNDCGHDPDKCTPGPDEAPCIQFNRAFPDNVFQKQGQTDFAVQHKTGFKNVQSKRYWNGTFGKTYGGPDNVVGGCTPPNNIASWLSYQRAPRRSKYQQITVSAYNQFDWFDSSPGVESKETAISSCDYVQTLDPHSGVFTISGWDLSPDSYYVGTAEPPQYSNQAIYKTSFAYWDLAQAVGRFTVPLTPGGTVTYTSNSITVTFGSPWGDQIFEVITWGINMGGTSTFDRVCYFYPIDRVSGNPVQVMTIHEQCQLTDTSIHYEYEEWDYGCGFWPPPSGAPFYSKIDVTGTLGNEVKDSDIYNDVCQNLLSTWNLADDEQYPWRTDTYVGVAPLVTRDELLFTGWTQAPSFVINDFGTTWPNGDLSANPGADIGSPLWDGITGVMPPTDPNSGVGYIAYPMTAPGTFDGNSVGNPFSFNTNPSYVGYRGTIAPGVSFNGGSGPGSGTLSGNSSATGNYGITVTVNSAPGFTGAIVGAPLPAGYGGPPSPNATGYFQFGFEDWLGCCEDDGAGFHWTWYRHGWGMSSSAFNADVGFALPTNATNWPNRWEQINKPQGAYLFYNDQTKISMPGDCDGTSLAAYNADALWACKYAEIVDVWPSQNFARPAGADKFAYDETQPVYEVDNVSGSGNGSTWQLYDANGNTISSASFPGIWGGKSVGGFYTGCSFSGGNVVLGTKVFNCPSDWQSASGQQSGGRSGSDDSGICFGQLRFPNCPSLLGRVAITPDSTGKNMTFTPKQTPFGMSAVPATPGQETVDLWDSNMNNLATAIVATRVDDTHFMVTGSYAKAAYVTINGAAKWYMADSDGKGDYALLQWVSDDRSNGEAIRLAGLSDCSGNPVGGGPSTNVGGGPIGNKFAFFSQTQGCVKFTPCGPKVICISPNGEFGTPYNFPPMMPDDQVPGVNDQFYFDEDYGSLWWGWFETTMTDLLWQSPHTPVGIIAHGNPDGYTLSWIEDKFNTGCPGDCQPGNPPCGDFEYQHWYRFQPQVETRLSVPCNYGQGQNECGPSLPPGITIGWLSPVTNSGDDVKLPPTPPGILDDSRPGLAMTAWSIHAGMCADAAIPCSLNYVVSGC